MYSILCFSPRLLQVVCGSTCITTGLVFSALHPPSACWQLASSSAKWAANWGEIKSSSFLCWCLVLISHLWTSTSPSRQYRRGPTEESALMQISLDQNKLSFNLRYLSELCCVDGPLGAGQAAFPVVSALLSASCNMSAITAVLSLSDGMFAQCRVALLRVLNCCPTCTMKHRITAATRTIQSCCRCWRAAVNLIHGQSLCSCICLQNK